MRNESDHTTAEHALTIRDPYRTAGVDTMDLHRMATALEILGALAPGHMPVHHCQILLLIASGGSAGVTYGDIERRFRLSNAAASRTVNTLSEGARHRKSALGLVEIIRDPSEGRRYRVRLTAKGAAVVRSIEAL
nr:hypothetical protein [uncultured Mediterranean phage uvMED]